MKIYNEIVFDVDGNVTYEDSYEYSGDVALCISITDYIRAQNEAQKVISNYEADRAGV